MRKIFILTTSFIVVIFSAFSQEIDQNLKVLSEQYRTSGLEDDAVAMSDMLHTEVTFYGPGGQPLVGKEAVEKVINYFLDKNDITAWEVTINKTYKEKNMLFEYGTFVIDENGNSIPERKYLNIWRKEKGKYKLFFRTWSPLK